ncbi:MAG: ParB/RepB/Spo0J family partition protein [Eubacteriales bacterium]|nr:ParB/RepB/Spo0J family partition protein [Eubacteriales bacterium]
MAKKRHGGLGRGLDALIPPARRENTNRNSGGGGKENSSGSAGEVIAAAAEDTVASGAGAAASESGAAASEAGTAAPETATTFSEAGAAVSEAGTAISGAGATAGAGAAVSEAGTVASGMGAAASEAGTVISGTGAAASESEMGASAAGAGFSGGQFTIPSQSGTTEQGEIRMLRLSQVDPNRSQPRQKFEEEALEELADSIRQFGVLQPILVKKNGSRYEIIAGERRWRASRKAGLREIPAIIRDYSNQETVELSLIENIQRENLNPIEEAKAFKRLLDEFGLRQEDLAARVSKSRTAITNAVRLLKLDERVQEMVVDNRISMGHARALIPVEIGEEQYLLACQVYEKKLSVRDVEKLVKKIAKNRAGGQKAGKTGPAREKDPALELAYKEIEERLKQSLGTKAAIRHSGNGAGKLEIEFYSNEDLEKIVDLLTMM